MTTNSQQSRHRPLGGRPLLRGWVGKLLTGITLKTYPVSLPPNMSAQFQADLVDVLCQ